MNKIQVDIDFKEGTLIPNGIDLITGDYNSTEIEFTFDEEHQNGRKVFEMKSPSKELVMLKDIVDNKIPLYGLKDITTMHNEKEYTKYIKDDLIYWYNQEDNELYDNEWNQVVTFDITEYTKVQEKASVFGEAGYYIFEISYYNNDGKLTSVHGKLPVNEEQVKVDDEVVEQYLPLFDQLIQEFVEIENTISTIQEEQITQNENIQTNANNIDSLERNKQDLLVSGENIKTINNESLLGSGNLEVVTDLSDYYTKEEIDNKGYINKDVDDLTNYTKTSDLSEVALSGSYNDLSNKPNLSVYSLITETGAKIDLEINSSTYVLTAKLYDKNNNLLSTSTGIDLPLETMVVGASYDSETKEIILTLKNGQEVRFSVADLVSGLVSETQLQQILLNYYTKSEVDTLLSNKVGFTDFPTNDGTKSGVIKTSSANAIYVQNDGALRPGELSYQNYLNSGGRAFIGKTTLENVITGKELTNKTYVDNANEVQDNEISDLKSENDYLNSIINQLPKVSSQGTILTLNNTINGRMNIELGTSELEQETTTGSNKLSQNKYISTQTINDIVYTNNGDGTFTLRGTASANTTINIIPYNDVVLEPNQAYYLYSSQAYNSTTFNLSLVSTEGGSAKYLLANGTRTTSADVSDSRLTFYIASGNTVNAQNVKLMLVKGTTEPASYEPYTGGIPAPNPSYPMPIHTISGNNKIVVNGKNLIGSIQSLHLLTNSSGLTEPNSRGQNLILYVGNNTRLSVDGDFSMSGDNAIRVGGYNTYPDLGVQGSRLANLSTDYKTINVSNYRYVMLTFLNGSTNALATIKANFMVSWSDTPLTYEPPISQEANINLGDIEYCEIGDYKDVFVRDNEGNWGIRKNIDKVVFTGANAENYGVNTNWDSTAPNILHIFTNDLRNTWKIGQSGFLSDKFICTIENNRDFAKEMLTCHTTNETPYFFIDYNRLNGVSSTSSIAEKVDAFKVWLSNNNVSLYYILATPTYTPITGTLAEQLENIYQYLLSYKGQTNISQVPNDLPFNISASALLDLNTLVGE